MYIVCIYLSVYILKFVVTTFDKKKEKKITQPFVDQSIIVIHSVNFFLEI